MVSKPLCPLYKNIIKPLDRARYPELRYYIRNSKVVSLGERLRPQDERLLPQHGTLGERLPPQHGTLEEKIPPQGKMYHGKHGTFLLEVISFDLMYHAEVVSFRQMYHAEVVSFAL